VAKILLAEDEGVIRMLLAEVLIEDGHQVIEAGDGREALALLVSDVDVIVSDMMMPRLGGAEWVAAARSRAELASVPVILMSALPLPDEAAGFATAFLQKPFRPSALARVVTRALDRNVQG
jgi:CheY-like chemotaxis protein